MLVFFLKADIIVDKAVISRYNYIVNIHGSMKSFYQYHQLVDGCPARTDNLKWILRMAVFIYYIMEDINQRTFEKFAITGLVTIHHILILDTHGTFLISSQMCCPVLL